MGSTIDLHIHTTASDGTDSPAELLAKIQAAGIRTFAVTDHDTIRGALEMKRIVPSSLRFIQGVEFSCKSEGGTKCHILGLNYDETNPEFLETLRAGDDLRHRKFYGRIEFMRENFGITFTNDEIAHLLSFPSVGKPHIANMLVAKGFAQDKQDAIDRYINKCRTGTGRLSAGFAVKAILSAGGVPVWAHPLGGEGEKDLPEEKFTETLEELLSFGLKGLECWYSKYKPERCSWLEQQAKNRGLLVSGGSDYHGKNKAIPLGRLNADDMIIEPDRLTILKGA